MSYYNQQPPYGGPPAQPPQQGYHPQGPPPPQSHSPYPPNQQAPMYNQNQQQQQYPPPQQQWGAPPPQQGGQWGGHQQPAYNQPPPQQQQQWGQPPPQQQWGQPPPQQYGQQQQWGAPQQQHQQPGGWGAPPPGQYQPPPQQQGYGAQVRPTSARTSLLGRVGKGVQALTAELKGSNQHYGDATQPHGADPRSDAIRIHKAISGIGTDEVELSLTLAAVQQPYQMQGLRQMYDSMYAHESGITGGKKDMVRAIEGDLSGDYKELCGVLARGPAEADAYFVHEAVSRPGTSEDLLNDVLLGRSNREIHDMKQAYRHLYGSDMKTDVGNDLSMKTKDLFMLVLDDHRPREEENAPCIPQNIQRDAAELKSSMRSTFGGLGKDTNAVCAVLAKRSNGQLRAIQQEYDRVNGHGSLEKDIKKKFSGHMEDALLLMLLRGADPFRADATQLEKSMKGVGTNEKLLSNRVATIHWDKQRLAAARKAYYHIYKKHVYDRVKGETSGDYEKLLLELLYPGQLRPTKQDPNPVQRYKDLDKR